MFKRLTAPERAAVTEAKNRRRRDLAEVQSSEIITDIIEHIPFPRQGKIRQRLVDMPAICRQTYLKAITGKSKAAAIRAFCWECMGHQRAEVADCTDLACPLWACRPSAENAQDEEDSQ
ncbi:MAG: hypothetical protein IMZ71_03130 [Chloroflexi bacterium]|nr:hypothetical protein [Chloroflexota bacterium]